MDGQDFRNVPVYRGAVKVSMQKIPETKKSHFLVDFNLRISFFSIQACVFDWAGTVCDAGVFAPGWSNI